LLPFLSNLLFSYLLSQNVKTEEQRIIISPIILYRCEIWSLTFRAENRLRVFKYRVLRRIFGPKWEEVTRG
jgi:hypothetical protein